MVRAVIFDLDGTLADSLGDIGGAMNEVLAAHGLPQHSLDAYRMMVGDGVDMLAKRAVGAAAVDPALVAEEYRGRYAGRIEQMTRPYPGIETLLDQLAQRSVPMAVLSNKRDDFTVELVRRQFSRWPFVEVRGERAGVPRKPDPAAAQDIARALNMPVEQTAFVGDTAIDMQTAVAAGMHAVGVLWGFRGRGELVAAGASVLLQTPADLLELL